MKSLTRRKLYESAVSRMRLFRRVQTVCIWYLLLLIPGVHLLGLKEMDIPLFSTGVIILGVAHYRRVFWRKVAEDQESHLATINTYTH